MKNAKTWVFAVVLLGAFAGLTPAATIDLKPGQYDFSVTYEIQGQVPSPPKRGPRCIPADDLDNPEKIFNDRMSDGFKADDSCIVRNFRNDGGKISYDADCSNRIAHVEGTVAQTEFSVVRDVKPKSGHSVSLKLTIAGKRTGDCQK
ncbi:MAG TPA: DUF3617 family protein [Candidatus Limnocylindrales bacterium]|nr:DUF3617 family protein [Candidatus Limnocylindrales bacterium]